MQILTRTYKSFALEFEFGPIMMNDVISEFGLQQSDTNFLTIRFTFWVYMY